jgi:protein-glutamine gamma-glutamyltransferase
VIRPEQKRERVAGWVLGGWLLLHQFLQPDSGILTPAAVVLLIAGILLRVFGIFPPAPAEWLLLAVAGIVAPIGSKSVLAMLGPLGGLFGAVLLLRPLSPRRGLWVLLCAVAVLASITLQESEVVNTVFVITDVAVLMFIAQQIHAPAEADTELWVSVFRSLRLVLPVAMIVTLAFWLFPAISSHTNVAFVRFAGGDLLSPGDVSEIRLSRRIAFVATISESSAVPGVSDLYWRGQVLEKNEGLRWSIDPARINLGAAPRGAAPDAGKWRYSQALGQDRTLAALDRPVRVMATTNGQKATVLETGPSAFSVLGTGEVCLEIASTPLAPDDVPLQALAAGSLEIPNKLQNDPRLSALALRLVQPGDKLSNTLESLGHFLSAGGYSYTLRPGIMRPGDVSWFLFQHRKGFCGHYAAAAANLLRMGGIPARIVTGYRGGTWNPWLRTFTLRDSDAHAWVEAWDDNERHWTRFDPTSFVAPGLSAMLELERDPDRWPWFRFATTYSATVLARTGRDFWAALSHHSPPVSWTAAVVIAGIFAAIWRILSRRNSKPDLAASCLAKLERQSGRPRLAGETPLAWLTRLETMSPNGSCANELRTIAASYECLVYAPPGRLPENIAALKAASKRLTRIWRKDG